MNEVDFEIENGVLKKYSGTEKNVIIPDGVTGIGDSAFAYCRDITNIMIPDSVTSIGERAFQNCSNLISLRIH